VGVPQTRRSKSEFGPVILPTGRAIALVSVAPLLALLLSAVNPTLWPLGLGYLAVALAALLIDGLLTMPRSALGIAFHPPGMLYVGEAMTLTLDLTPGGRRVPARIEATLDHDPIVAMPGLITIACQGAEALRSEIPILPKRRGTAHLPALWLRWVGPYGLMRRQVRHRLDASLRIVPNIRAVRAAAIALSKQDSIFGIKDQRQLGDGSEFDALRDYQAGFDRRAIDWKHSARHRRLVCKEFRTERNHQIVLAFDTGHLMREPMGGVPRLDHAINAGLLLGYASLKGGDRVGLFGFDSKVRLYAEPVGGVDRFQRLQHLTAELDYATEETNFTLGLGVLAQHLRRRSLIVLITDFVDTITAELMLENLGRLSTRHLVLFVTLQDPELPGIVDAEPGSMESVARSVVAEEFRRERLIVFERLRRLGVQCLEAPQGRIGTDLINRYLAIKQRELI
jgi:uncharacterized protein (DUF58 family)